MAAADTVADKAARTAVHTGRLPPRAAAGMGPPVAVELAAPLAAGVEVAPLLAVAVAVLPAVAAGLAPLQAVVAAVLPVAALQALLRWCLLLLRLPRRP